MTEINIPLTQDAIESLHAGQSVLLSGAVYTARDAAHARLHAMLQANQPLPFELSGSGLYYAGPCPDMPGRVINSCGPTTSSRMNAFAPLLYDMGVKFVIGKGPVSSDVRSAIVRNGAVYFAAVGGAGALIASRPCSSTRIAIPSVSPEPRPARRGRPSCTPC